MKMSEWQPIETAPKDGTGFIYFQGLLHEQKWIGSAVWHKGKFLHVQWDRCQDDWLEINPTYWMPLPDPPQ
jgi:hypothetical protein